MCPIAKGNQECYDIVNEPHHCRRGEAPYIYVVPQLHTFIVELLSIGIFVTVLGSGLEMALTVLLLVIATTLRMVSTV